MFPVGTASFCWHFRLLLLRDTWYVHINLIAWHLPGLLPWWFRNCTSSTNSRTLWTSSSSAASAFLFWKFWSWSFTIKVVHANICLSIFELWFSYVRLYLQGRFSFFFSLLFQFFNHVFVHSNFLIFFCLFSSEIVIQLLVIVGQLASLFNTISQLFSSFWKFSFLLSYQFGILSFQKL